MRQIVPGYLYPADQPNRLANNGVLCLAEKGVILQSRSINFTIGIGKKSRRTKSIGTR